MLKPTFKFSQEDENVNRCRLERVLRTAPKVKMKIDFTDKEKVRRSPYYVCNKLWDKLDSTTQSAMKLCDFTNKIKSINMSDL